MLGVERTFLPWRPDDADAKTKTTFLWPLISTAHMAAETGSNEQQTPVFLDDALAKEISPGGRLNQMVALGKDLDITWVLDPDLLASVDAMTESYEVRNEDGSTTPASTRPSPSSGSPTSRTPSPATRSSPCPTPIRTWPRSPTTAPTSPGR